MHAQDDIVEVHFLADRHTRSGDTNGC
jgi:hypothetical protein